jgi:hypothetical protein
MKLNLKTAFATLTLGAAMTASAQSGDEEETE